MEFMKEKMMFPFWMALPYFISFFASATIRKSMPSKRKIKRE